MDSLTLIDKREQLKKKAEDLISIAEKELRKLNDKENDELNSIKKEIADLDNEIKNIENRNTKTNKVMAKFSLLKAINDVANNRQLDERAQEVVSNGIAEMRKAGQSFTGQIVLPMEMRSDIQATVAKAGQENVAEDKLGILEPLRANLVLVNAGASYMTGLMVMCLFLFILAQM